jgi:hypothetical protein
VAQKTFMVNIGPENQSSITSTQRLSPYWRRRSFESESSIAQVLNVDHATGLHGLHEKLGFKSYCLRRVLHVLIGELKAKCKKLTRPMIPDIETARKDGWKHLVMGDQSRFFLLSDPRRIWSLAKDEVTRRSKVSQAIT